MSVGEEDPWQTSIPITKLHLEETVKKFRRLLERRSLPTSSSIRRGGYTTFSSGRSMPCWLGAGSARW